MEYTHRPVLLKEVLAGLDIQADGVYVDGTFGRGGHAGAILQSLPKRVLSVAVERTDSRLRLAASTEGLDRLDIYLDNRPRLSSLVSDGETQLEVDDAGTAQVLRLRGFEAGVLVGRNVR